MKFLYVVIEQHMIVGRIALRQDVKPAGQPHLKQTAKVKAADRPKVKLVEKKVVAPKEKAMPRRRPPEPSRPPPWHQDLLVLSVGTHIGKAAIYGYIYTHANTHTNIYKCNIYIYVYIYIYIFV